MCGRLTRRPDERRRREEAEPQTVMTDRYETIIGLEVHAQLATATKMFCGCRASFGAAPNTQTCPVCLGLPGSLPVINRRAVEFGIMTALAIGCGVNTHNRFARKHYYYPDMPKNYQITQYEEPLAERGGLAIAVGGATREIGIERLHLEEDVGKLLHEGALETAQASSVDFNRAGVPLMEIVSKPDLRSPEEAAAYLRTLRAILIYLRVCDGNMEEGSLRCDANISLRPRGQAEYGTKVEIKNMNSFRNVRDALEHEIRRQTRALETGVRIVQETRLWDPERAVTVSMRSKEFAHDYRYFPEPDLPPLHVQPDWVGALRSALPELPAARRARFETAYALTAYEADLLTQGRGLADYFEDAARASGRPKAVANWVLNELLRELPADDDRAVAACPVPPAHLAGLLGLIDDGTISGKIAKDVFEKMYRSGETAQAIVSREGLTQVADEGALGAAVERVLAEHPKVVEDFRGGKKAALGFLVGQVMKATAGKANPALVNRLLMEKLPKV
jgi:aspartyl-tRNA(Asn)/glutamyl-tRNA(Gln) amidotransferase subunit B